jgi:SAM-dependent methyltransferase
MIEVNAAAARNYLRFETFLDGLVCEVYPEPPSEPHVSITGPAIDQLHKDNFIRRGMRVLDVGCGQRLALERFRSLGIEAVGITLGPQDLDVCRSKGFEVRPMDQNFMDFPDNSFDLLSCRHILEHSVVPLSTLSEYRRVLKPDGLVYIEVPAPDTSSHQEQNRNHYSVLPKSSWLSLMQRSGLTLQNSIDLNFNVPCGPDTYWAFLLRRSSSSSGN